MRLSSPVKSYAYVTDGGLAAAAGLADDLDLARRALGECKRLMPNVTIAWVEKYYPMVRTEDRSRYIDGLRRAGLE